MNRFKQLIGWGDSRFYRLVISLALPIMLQQGLASALYLIDNVMVGRLGETAIAAVGVGNQLTFLLQVFGFGINSGAGIFVAQYWGRKDLEGIHRIEGVALVLSLAIGALFTVVAVVFGTTAASVFSHDANVIELAVKYLKIAGFGYVFQLIAQSLGVVLRSSGNAVLPMLATLCGVVTNGVLNYIFIFGKLGVKAMGVEGAALATVIASAVNLAVIIVVSIKKKNSVAAPFRSLMSFSKSLFAKFFGVSLPVFFNEALWSLGITMYSVLYGILGTPQQAAMQIYSTVDKIGFIMMAGLGSACGVMVGNALGERDVERANLYSKRMLIITPLALVAVGLVLHIFLPVFMSLFVVTPQVAAMAEGVMRVYASVMWVYSINYTIIIGTLRAGGDTRFASVIDVSTLWFIALPLAYFTGLIACWQLWAIYLITITGDATKALLGIRRIRTGKWINILERED